MNWSALFFSAEGRLGQKDFWLAVVILLIGGSLAHALAGLGTLIWFLSTYCWICIYAKRLHDMGRSGWLQIVPWVLGWLLIGAGGVMGLGGFLAALLTGFPHFAGGMVLGGMAVAVGFLCLSGLMHLVFLLWLGLTPGQTGPNRYGPEPGGPAVSSAA